MKKPANRLRTPSLFSLDVKSLRSLSRPSMRRDPFIYVYLSRKGSDKNRGGSPKRGELRDQTGVQKIESMRA